jgi:DNA-binding NtrC family response regulator
VDEAERNTENRIAVDVGGRRRLSLLVMGERGVFTYPLPDEGVLRIGRSEQCEISVGDAQLSREHAKFVVGSVLAIVDLGSSNGTCVDGVQLVAHEAAPLLPGSVVTMGNTVVVVQHASAEARTRQLWSHGYFESRLEEECARAAQRKTTFAVLRVRFDPATAGAIEWRLSASVGPEHVVAGYAPGQYEVLLSDVSPEDAERQGEELAAALAYEGTPGPEVTVACFPRDGRTPEALLGATTRDSDDDEAPELPPGGALERLRTVAERFAAGTIPVLLLGETGVGKDVLSAMIHRLSPRVARPYVCINCGALPVTLVESALFGHERGAFTGATSSKEGLLESANGGTVFLDEVAEIPLAAQATLLRVLDQGEVLRVGATRTRPIDVRFIAATNRDLEHEVDRGRFRQDLYFRLAAATIVIPPLRERVAEVGPLARAFVRRACRELSRARVPRILPEALTALERHAWPGNVRELRNVVERAVLLAGDGDIGVAQLPQEKMGGRRLPTQVPPSGRRLSDMPPRPPSLPPPSMPPPSSRDGRTFSTAPPRTPSMVVPPPPSSVPSSVPPLHVSARMTEALARDPEAANLLAVLDACDWNQTKAAKKLGISRRTLVSRLSAYGLTRKRTP